MSALVLLSGGQDSTVCLHQAMREHATVHALSIDYGQRHLVELQAAVKVASYAQIASHEIVHLDADILQGASPLVDHHVPVPLYQDVESLPGGIEVTFIPCRNLLFLTVAANRATWLQADTIYLGVSGEDQIGYPDCRPPFIAAMEMVLHAALQQRFFIVTPLIHLNKRETVELALGLPGCMHALSHTHTCYRGDVPPCGRCHACLLRARGFAAAGVADPLLTRLGIDLPTGSY